MPNQRRLNNTIADYHQFAGLPKPEHPLVSVVRFDAIKSIGVDKPNRIINNFYSIALKRNFNGKLRYGQLQYDFDISRLETLLNYAERFYRRQFITRKISNHQILNRLEAILADYFSRDDLMEKGLPSVGYIAEALNLSPVYLTGLLNVLTGQSTQQHIHNKLIDKAKEKLSTTDLSISDIAYALGFEHPQSFSKLFKTKTTLSPLAFRQSFN